jgi:ABC-type transport system involved in multi-copper enzyme maturation permease subunit
MAQFAASFFFTFAIVQFLVLGLLTPVYTASAIAEEKDRKTLEFLLATDLGNREIVLSKLASRLCNLTLLALTGLPILSLMQFLGGVDPNLVLACFAATGITMASAGSLSILLSVYAKKPRDAIVLTYLTMLAYLGFSALAYILKLFPSVISQPLNFWAANPIRVEDVIDCVGAGNLAVVCYKIIFALERRLALSDFLTGLLGNYALFHAPVIVGCALWAVARVRAVAVKQTYGEARKTPRSIRAWKQQPIGEDPMLWKELVAERRTRPDRLAPMLIAFLVIGSFVPAAWILIYYIVDLFEGGYWPHLADAMNAWVRGAGTILACLMLLNVALRAPSSVSGERDRQTLDNLLTTPLSTNDILYAKWLGSILSLRWAWLWVGMIWLLGLVTGGMHPLTVPVVLGAWFVYAAFLASLGLWFSIWSRTTLRANIWTIGVTAGFAVGHWLAWTCCLPLFDLSAQPPSRQVIENVQAFELYSFTPPVTLGWLAFFEEGFGRPWYKPFEYFVYACVALAFCGGGALAFWLAAHGRFLAKTGRGVPWWWRPIRLPLWRRPIPPVALPAVMPVVEGSAESHKPREGWPCPND